MTDAGLNGGKRPPYVVLAERVDRIDERLDEQDAKIGGAFRESAAAREAAERAEAAAGRAEQQAAGGRLAAERAANEVNALTGELRDERLSRQRECDIRHEGVNARLARVEAHDDTLTATSAVTMSDEALRRRYEERKAEVASLTDRVSQLESTAKREIAAKHAAQTDASKSKASAEAERQKAKRAMWVAIPAIAMAVAGIVTSILQALGR